jgi:hypothetical protein
MALYYYYGRLLLASAGLQSAIQNNEEYVLFAHAKLQMAAISLLSKHLALTLATSCFFRDIFLFQMFFERTCSLITQHNVFEPHSSIDSICSSTLPTDTTDFQFNYILYAAVSLLRVSSQLVVL